MNARSLLTLLEQTVCLPTAPYNEGEVIAHAEEFCAARGIAVRRDPYGNIVMRTGRGAAGSAPALVFSAHMDHPAFEIVDTSGALVKARWMGGVEPEYFAGAKVKVFSTPPTTGVCVRTELQKERRRVEVMHLDLEDEVQVGDLGMWNVIEWQVNGAVVHCRAADDLAGCAAVLGALSVLGAEGTPAWGLLTRAEEVGFHGALGAMEAGSIPAGFPMVSVEASKEVESARQGLGPVVRVGDKVGVFHPGLCRYLEQVAAAIQEQFADFSWQRALMDGGTCEATPYSLYGHPTAGIAVPLGNYHNRLQGERSLGAETVHSGDFFGAVTLMVEAARGYAAQAPAVLPIWKDELLRDAGPGMERLCSDGLAGD